MRSAIAYPLLRCALYHLSHAICSSNCFYYLCLKKYWQKLRNFDYSINSIDSIQLSDCRHDQPHDQTHDQRHDRPHV